MGGKDFRGEEKTRPAGTGNVSVIGFDLAVTDGPDAGLVAEVRPGRRLILGTSRFCDIRLRDTSVSRRHLLLEVDATRLKATDLDSTNGTRVNDAQVLVAILVGGERVRIGESTLTVTAKPMPPAEATTSSFGRMVGASPAMVHVFSEAERLAAMNVAVLVEGEAGTGKELLAECIHEASRRSGAPFLVLDGRAPSRNVFDRAIFGEGDQPGIFEAARGGTVFVDEPSNLDLGMQATLFRALQVVDAAERAGEAPYDVRIVTATTADLDRLVDKGRFMDPLYTRLSAARIELPPLRSRREDLPILADAFFRAHGRAGAIPQGFLDRIEDHDWPGNVRELEEMVARFVADEARSAAPAPEASLSPAAPPERGGAPRLDGTDAVVLRVLEQKLPFPEARRQVLDEFDRIFVAHALAEHGGHVGRASAAYGIGRRYFQLIRSRGR